MQHYMCMCGDVPMMMPIVVSNQKSVRSHNGNGDGGGDYDVGDDSGKMKIGLGG